MHTSTLSFHKKGVEVNCVLNRLPKELGVQPSPLSEETQQNNSCKSPPTPPLSLPHFFFHLIFISLFLSASRSASAFFSHTHTHPYLTDALRTSPGYTFREITSRVHLELDKLYNGTNQKRTRSHFKPLQMFEG